VTELGQKGWQARGFDVVRRRWPRRLGENGEEGTGVDNKRTREVQWCLVKLLERLAGGERERAHELKAAAAMVGGSLGWRAEGRTVSFYRWLGVRG
jgi:hypothetical protein